MLDLNKNNKNAIYIIGDSHAGQLAYGFQKEINKKNNYALNVFNSSCQLPFLNFETATVVEEKYKSMRKKGAELISNALKQASNDPNTKLVILAHNPFCSYHISLSDKEHPDVLDKKKLYKIGARRTFDLFIKKRIKVIFILDNPTTPYEYTKCLLRPFSITSSGFDFCKFEKSFHLEKEEYIVFNKIIKDISLEYNDNVRTVDLSELLCDDKYCYISKNNTNLYYDNSHLNHFGSEYVAPSIMEEAQNLIDQK